MSNDIVVHFGDKDGEERTDAEIKDFLQALEEVAAAHGFGRSMYSPEENAIKFYGSSLAKRALELALEEVSKSPAPVSTNMTNATLDRGGVRDYVVRSLRSGGTPFRIKVVPIGIVPDLPRGEDGMNVGQRGVITRKFVAFESFMQHVTKHTKWSRTFEESLPVNLVFEDGEELLVEHVLDMNLLRHRARGLL